MNWLRPSREDHPKVWSSSPLSPGTLMGPRIERLWMLGLRKWKITFMPPRLVSTRLWNLPNSIWRAMPPHGGGRWGKRKGKPMATHGNSSRSVLSWNSFPRISTTFWGVNWCTPNSLKDSNVSPSRKQQKKEESGHAPQLTTLWGVEGRVGAPRWD